MTSNATEMLPITLRTWMRFLLGDVAAILSVARSRQALWLGLLFVLSAGLAREYDGAYLAREPWHLILPAVASLATSGLLFLLVKWAAVRHGLGSLGWAAGYRTVLTFFWMTAPLAWIYALPVERWFEPGLAMRLNLFALGIVSLWRVLVISRALGVWLGASTVAMFWIVIFFGLTVALVLSWLTPTPIWDLMGGVRLPPAEQSILNFKLGLWLFGVPGWFVLCAIACYVMFERTTTWTVQAKRSEEGPRVGRSAWLLGAALAVLGGALLLVGQPEQARAYYARQLLSEKKLDDAARYLAETPRDAFPPHWSPPPNLAYGEREPKIVDMLAAIDRTNGPPWLRNVYLEKLASSRYALSELVDAAVLGNVQGLEALLNFWERDPASAQLTRPLKYELREAADNEQLDSQLRDRIRRLLGEKDENHAE